MSFLDRIKKIVRGPEKPSNFARTVEFDVVLETPLLRVTHLGDRNDPNLFICFTGISQAMGGIGAEEFVGSTSLPGYSALFVSDLTRSWFNAFEPADLFGLLADYTGGKKIVTIGNSMGGFGAIWASRHLPVEVVVAFAPQFSVHPDIVPAETRWTEYRRAITRWRCPSLAEHFVPQTRYFTLNGDADAEHFGQFTHGDNMTHILLPDSGHQPAAKLKEGGVLQDVLESCINGRDPMPKIKEAGLTAEYLEAAHV